jgi:opacity protein-like surface antigen
LVYRPLHTRWIFLDRLDFLVDRQRGGGATSLPGISGTSTDTDSRRIVNNLNINYKPDTKLQISFQYGAKYAMETIDSLNYSGYTDLFGIEGRYDLTKVWDVGVRGSVLHSWSARQFIYSAGPSVGVNVVKNVWISIGYNVTGFADKDFSAADYTAQGPFVRFRFKFDQNSVKEAANWVN